MGLADCGLGITSDEEADLESRRGAEARRFFLMGTRGATVSAGDDDGGRLTHRLRHRERIEGKDEKKRSCRKHHRAENEKSGSGSHETRGWMTKSQDRLARLILPVYWA